MKRFAIMSAVLFLSLCIHGQQEKSKQEVSNIYRASPEKINDLVHTKLSAGFDFLKSRMNGKVWITLRPHFYPTDSLSLDAKGMEINQVCIEKKGKYIDLRNTYDGAILKIQLDRTYTRKEDYTIYIVYTAKPDEYKGKGSVAINDAKGLYFINPKGEEKNKPTQVWTQGETESNSVWLPTIDKPNQKTTDEIIMTVPSKYSTLSNGILVSQKNNADGTRTDYWKMDLPHAPYLIFMGIGEYAIIKDKYRNKEVNYYVEKEYAPVARRIFGHTPEMISFFSRITGIEYPWQKYSQIVGRDYVSGAMENTTATLHQESAQQDARELTDGNIWEDDISHELFHQWFGDYVTTESWSNITLNESFANYSEYLWQEYKYGKDAADELNYTDMLGYLTSNSENKDLVRFYYNDKEDVFDRVSYNKGGRILHMLRKYAGDSAFFRSLNLYLNTYKFKSAEAQQLRLAFEDVTGKDLNWFWNQWYYGSGHPKLNITYGYDPGNKMATMVVEQTQSSGKVFTLPVNVDIWNKTSIARSSIWIKNKIDTFSFHCEDKPSLINFDADKILLAQKTENKSLEDYFFQYRHAKNYMDRREAVEAALKKQAEQTALQIILSGLHDPYPGLRIYTISHLDLTKDQIKGPVEAELKDLAEKDGSRLVKAAAITKLGDYKNPAYTSLFNSAINDSSYSVAGSSLEALGKIDSASALKEAKRLAALQAKGKLMTAINHTLIRYGDESSAEIILRNFEILPLGQSKFEMVRAVTEFLGRVKSFETLKRGVDDMIFFQNGIPEAFRGQVATFINGQLLNLQKKKLDAGQKDQADYITSKLLKDKKGF